MRNILLALHPLVIVLCSNCCSFRESRVQNFCGILKGGLAVRVPHMVSKLNLDETMV